MTLRQLKYFIEIARAGSLTLAAQALSIAQPALSAQMAALETELGVRLFERHSKGVELSVEGRRLFQHALTLIADADALKSKIRESEDRPSGKAKLCIGGAIAGLIAPALLRSVSVKYPEIELVIVEGVSADVQALLESRKVDIAMMAGAFDVPGLATLPVLEEKIDLIGSTALIGEDRSPIGLAELAHLPLAATNPLHDTRRIIDHVAAHNGVTLNIRYELNSAPMLIGVVKAGLAYSLLTANSCVDALASGALAKRPVSCPQLVRLQTIVWLKTRQLSPAATAMRDELALAIRSLVDQGQLSGRLI